MSELAMLDLHDLKKLVRLRLNDDWIIVQGNGASLVEYQVYPPGTEKNSLFELVMLPGFPLRTFFFAKKIQELREIFRGNLTDYEWENLFMLILIKVGENQAYTDIRSFKPNKKQEAIENFIRDTIGVLEQWPCRHVEKKEENDDGKRE